MERKVLFLAVLASLTVATSAWPSPEGGATTEVALVTPGEFVSLLFGEAEAQRATLKKISRSWQPGYAAMLLEILSFARDPVLRKSVVFVLEKHTSQRFGHDVQGWYEWIWNQPAQPHPAYPEFKSELYGHVDPRFAGYFATNRTTKIRLDEVRWGGVSQDGIPPLRSPEMISAADADYLDDSNIVFGLEVNGDARAYPKRILAWHEMFTDEVGGVPVAGVYCTLCGTAILYETELDGVRYELGTSGFLYRSNKLMYDRATQSLWNTIWGHPVIGPLADKQIQLRRGSVVTTTWGEWRRRHPQSGVLSLNTGHQRDYSEGAAYREYFATDELMFNVPKLDGRLKNKAEVLTLLPERLPGEPLAISAKFLAKNEIYADRIGAVPFVVLTDRSGANRVYRSGGVEFVRWDLDRQAEDKEGVVWTLGEDRLEAPDGRQLARFPAQRAFWFGWYAAYPNTRLVK